MYTYIYIYTQSDVGHYCKGLDVMLVSLKRIALHRLADSEWEAESETLIYHRSDMPRLAVFFGPNWSKKFRLLHEIPDPSVIENIETKTDWWYTYTPLNNMSSSVGVILPKIFPLSREK